MLRKLHIINFESHKDTTVEFTEGFNVIIGDSDAGKSSIIRALSAVCYNRWSSDMMRLNEKECVIELTTDKGIVRLIKNIKDKINAYECVKFGDNEELVRFETIGTSVPEIVFEITGMRELELGDTKDTPNVMYQLEKHYMLAEVSGKSCTSNLIARIFDKVIGLGGMEELISEISGSMLNNKKQITKNNEKIDQIRQKMHSDVDIKEKESIVTNSKQILEEITLLQEKYNDVDYFDVEINKLRERWKTIDNRAIAIDTNKAKSIADSLKTDSDNYNSIDLFVSKFSRLEEQSKRLENTINSIKSIEQNEIDNLKQQCNQLFLMNKMIEKYQLKTNQINEIENNISFFDSEYNKYNEQLIQIKKDNKICPLCGNPFSNCGDIK